MPADPVVGHNRKASDFRPGFISSPSARRAPLSIPDQLTNLYTLILLGLFAFSFLRAPCHPLVHRGHWSRCGTLDYLTSVLGYWARLTARYPQTILSATPSRAKLKWTPELGQADK